MSMRDDDDFYTYACNDATGVEYLKWTDDEGATRVIGTTRDGKQFRQNFPGDGSQDGIDSNGNYWYVPSKR